MSDKITTIAVVGTGVIGSSWTSEFLAAGYKVRATDPAAGAEDRLRAFVKDAWPALEALGRTGGTSAGEALETRLSFDPKAEVAAEGADFVQENAPERPEIKRSTYAALESALAPDAVIASSTSGIMPSDLQQGMDHPERLVVGHPFNPPHLIPLVEVVPGKATSEDTAERAMAFYRALGKTPIRLHKEVVGHVANRLQAAIWREAVYLAREGVASVEDIDLAVAAGPGQRWAIMGPTKVWHLAGGTGGMAHFLDHLGPAVETWWKALGTATLDEPTRKMLSEAYGTENYEQEIHLRDRALLRRLNDLAADRKDAAETGTKG